MDLFILISFILLFQDGNVKVRILARTLIEGLTELMELNSTFILCILEIN